MEKTSMFGQLIKPTSKKLKEKKSNSTRLLLVRKKPNKYGRQVVSSSSDGIIDIAVAIEIGILPSIGIHSVLHQILRKRVLKLLESHELKPIKTKYTTLEKNHATTQIRKLAKLALPKIIGPQYWDENSSMGKNALHTKVFVSWVKKVIEDESSELCQKLTDANFKELVGLKRNYRWWQNIIDLR